MDISHSFDFNEELFLDVVYSPTSRLPSLVAPATPHATHAPATPAAVASPAAPTPRFVTPATPPLTHVTLTPAPAAPVTVASATETSVEPAHALIAAPTNAPPQRTVTRRRTTRARKPSIASLRAQAEASQLIVTYLPYVLRDLNHPSYTAVASEENDPAITGDPDAQRICSSLKRMVVLSKETQEEIAKRTEYLRLLKRHLEGTADLRRLMRGLQLDSWFWMCERWRTLSPDYYVPYPEERCYEIVQETLEAIKTHELPHGTKENGAFGWLDSVHLDDDGHSVRFATRKTLPNTDMKQLVDHTWSVYSDGDSLKQSHHGDRCEMFHQTLQEISPDMMIVHRVEKYADLVQLTHSIGIIFRVKTEKGYMIVSRCIESPRLQSLMKGDGLSLCEAFFWDTFDVVHGDGEDEIEYSLTGKVGSDDRTYANRWRNEILIALIRYESQLTDKPMLSIELHTEDGGELKPSDTVTIVDKQSMRAPDVYQHGDY